MPSIEFINPCLRIFYYHRAINDWYRVRMKPANYPKLWIRIMTVVGSVGLLVGALDPLEGSIAIVIGSGLWALGTFLGHNERGLVQYRALVFGLITFGVAAMWALSAMGGMGGKSGHSMWWGLLVLPYLVGYLMAVAGPGNPRWFLCFGIVVGLWYLVLCTIVLSRPIKPSGMQVAILLVCLGLTIVGSCVARLAGSVRRLRTIPSTQQNIS